MDHHHFLPGTLLKGPVELTNCDREPIHTPAAIQAFGCLVVVRLDDRKVVSISANAEGFSFFDALPKVDQTIGEDYVGLAKLIDSLVALADGSTIQQLVRETFHQSDDVMSANRLALKEAIESESCSTMLTAHKCDGLAFLEFEPQDAGVKSQTKGMLETLFAQIDRAHVEQAHQRIVEFVREVTGFDRVMLYQFHADDHGSVIAEAKSDEQESFFGLHYPAADIPLPARRLYELKWIRSIADSHAQGIAMDPPLVSQSSDDGGQENRPIDMSFCALRAISPIHLEYMRNMGVRGSMSISVLNAGKLWGLLACHHRQPKVVPPAMRNLCELAGSLLSVFLTSRRQENLLEQQVQTNEEIFANAAEISVQDDFGKAILESAPWMSDLFKAIGFVWSNDDDQQTWGDVPAAEQITSLLEALESENDRILFTDKLGQWNPSFKSLEANLPGVLAMKFAQRSGGTLLFFRPPYKTQIDWAGDPSKNEADESGRLSPRKSFAMFTQSVGDRSLPWSDSDRETAETLMTSLSSVVARQAARLLQINDELRQINTDQDAFSYAASHDLKEPLRRVNHHLSMLEQAEGLAGPAFDRGMSSMKRLTLRMGELIDGLLRFSQAGRQQLSWERVGLKEVVDQAMDMVFGGVQPKDVRVTMTNDAEISCDFVCLREIFSNLISNARKYNNQSVCEIEIGQTHVSDTPLVRFSEFGNNVIFVKDNGIGINAENHEKIFEIFTRVHDQEAYGGGSGAGLTIVRRMVERHGGKVVVQSNGELKEGANVVGGSTFYFGWEAQ